MGLTKYWKEATDYRLAGGHAFDHAAMGVGVCVNSISALRALGHLSNVFAFVTGYYNVGDGGGGPYRMVAATTGAYVDNGGNIIVANDGSVWELINSGNLNVAQFGAKGDGVTDDTTKFTAALGALGSGGGKITIPPGKKYYIGSNLTIPASCSLIGPYEFTGSPGNNATW